MGRKSTGRYPNGMSRFTVNLDSDLYDKIKVLAEKSKCSVSEVILYYVDNIEDKDVKDILKWKSKFLV